MHRPDGGALLAGCGAAVWVTLQIAARAPGSAVQLRCGACGRTARSGTVFAAVRSLNVQENAPLLAEMQETDGGRRAAAERLPCDCRCLRCGRAPRSRAAAPSGGPRRAAGQGGASFSVLASDPPARRGKRWREQ
jgi:hypothetical protein